MTRKKLSEFDLWIEDNPSVIIILLTALYLALIIAPMRNIFWHDELFTFYIAQSPNLESLFKTAKAIDWQPPLFFLAARFSQTIFGITEFGTRLPSVLSFYFGSMGLLFALKRKVGICWAAVPILLLWFSFYFKYATEARPYGLLLGCFFISLYSYINATDRNKSHRKWYLLGIFVGNAGMMLSHVLAPFFIMPFGIAELTRSVQQRRLDRAMWLVIICPLLFAFEYISMSRGFGQTYFPKRFQASPKMAVLFYVRAIRYVWPIILLGMITTYVFTRFWRQTGPKQNPEASASLVALFLGSLLSPILINLVLMRSAGAFWERYCITSAVAIYVLCALTMGWASAWRPQAGLAVFCVVLTAGLVATTAKSHPPFPLYTLDNIHPELPLVDASGLAFLEMDHYEKPALVNRLHYLTDRNAAIRYSHATLFEGFDKLYNYFPIRAHIGSYEEFVRQNRHFLVFATPNYPEDWLLAKLADDGALIQPLKWLRTPYSPYVDEQIFEVTFR